MNCVSRYHSETCVVLRTEIQNFNEVLDTFTCSITIKLMYVSNHQNNLSFNFYPSSHMNLESKFGIDNRYCSHTSPPIRNSVFFRSSLGKEKKSTRKKTETLISTKTSKIYVFDALQPAQPENVGRFTSKLQFLRGSERFLQKFSYPGFFFLGLGLPKIWTNVKKKISYI